MLELVFLILKFSTRGCLWPLDLISVQFSRSVVSDSATPWTAARQASLSIINSWSLPKPMPIELVIPSNHLILCCPLLLLLSIFPSIRVFSNESACHIRWPAKVLEFQLQNQSYQWTPRTDLGSTYFSQLYIRDGAEFQIKQSVSLIKSSVLQISHCMTLGLIKYQCKQFSCCLTNRIHP